MKAKQTFQINIPDPCHEDWNQMTPNERGRHCDACQKTVIDFTKYTDWELAQLIKQNQGQLCGQFRPDQLGRNIPKIIPTRPFNHNLAAGLLLGGLLFSGLGIMNAQDSRLDPVEMIETNPTIKKYTLVDLSINDHSKHIEGILISDQGEMKFDNVKIYIQGTSTIAHIRKDGAFSLAIRDAIKTEKLNFIITENDQQVQKIIRSSSFAVNDPEVSLVGYQPTIKGYPTMGIMIVDHAEQQQPVTRKLFHNFKAWLKRSFTFKKKRKTSRYEDQIASVIDTESPNNEVPTSQQKDISIFPNPFQDAFSIRFDSKINQTIYVQLYSPEGKMVYAQQQSIDTGGQIIEVQPDQSNLVSGIYYLTIEEANGERHRFSVAKTTNQ